MNTILINIYSAIEEFCHRYRVEMKTPENINKFLDEMDTIRQNRGKAAHLLFNDIE
jgi:hypothetical protein